MDNTQKMKLSWMKETLNVFSPCVSERATVQVPTGLHSQTVVTGWSNYWVADTPAWQGFISSRKRDSQITVYPHRTPSSGLIPQLQTGKPHTDTMTLLTYKHPHAQKPRQGAASNHNGRLSFIPHVCVCSCVTTCPDRALVSCQTHLLAPSKHVEWQHYAGVSEREALQQKGWKRHMTLEYYLIYILSLNNNSTLEDGSFDPLTHRCIFTCSNISC